MLQYLFFKFLNKNVNQINKSGIKKKEKSCRSKVYIPAITIIILFHYSFDIKKD